MRIRLFQLAVLFMLPFMAASAQESKSHNFDVAKNMQVFNEIYSYLDLMYVDTLNADEVVGTAINIAVMKKNKKFQKEQLASEGYTEIEEFFVDKM